MKYVRTPSSIRQQFRMTTRERSDASRPKSVGMTVGNFHVPLRGGTRLNQEVVVGMVMFPRQMFYSPLRRNVATHSENFLCPCRHGLNCARHGTLETALRFDVYCQRIVRQVHCHIGVQPMLLQACSRWLRTSDTVVLSPFMERGPRLRASRNRCQNIHWSNTFIVGAQMGTVQLVTG